MSIKQIFSRQILASIVLLLFAFSGIQVLKSCKNHVAMKRSGTYLMSVPLAANCWIGENTAATSRVIGETGILLWDSANDTLYAYFRTEKPGELKLGINTRIAKGDARLGISIGNKTRFIKVQNNAFDTLYIGKFQLDSAGYQCVKIFGDKKSDQLFPEIQSLVLGGEVVTNETYFIKDEVYWGRRGPSVHLSYIVPENAGDIKFFYNEITVPEGNDILGSYFMANGFGEGYFGIQVNSETERRILFSVWSPFVTDNPNDIPENKKIKLINKGENVYTGEFGNEGSGGQSYLKFNWKTGQTYGFLMQAEPQKNNSTTYTARFFDPETQKWMLIASFNRPDTHTFLTRPHSFLENFYTETGNISRQVFFSNQWIYTTQNQWIELNKARFTTDATGRKKSRLDFTGGKTEHAFYLKNCGFFNQNTEMNEVFIRKNSSSIPNIMSLNINIFK